jgi:hypothetical protein
MIILEYKLDAGEQGMRCPPWIDDGGYWLNTDNTMVGTTRDNPEFHIPSTVVRLTPLELEDRQVAIHTANPMMKHTDDPTDEPVEMTEAEVRTAIQDWVASK